MDWSHRLTQPDPRSCGAAVLVVARMIHDPAYADLVLTGSHPGTGFTLPGGTVRDRFTHEVLAMHRRTTGPVDVAGTLQLPWPRGLGTPPWAVARQMSGSSGVPGTTYDAEVINPLDRRGALDTIVRTARDGHIVPFYTGNRWSPRHVMLVLDPDLLVYEPSSGRRKPMDPEAFVAGRLDLAGWSTPWFSVLPR